jgi:hypothetical protein
LKRKTGLSLKSFFSGGSANEGRSLKPVGPLPGQKIIRLAKKGEGSSFPNAGFRRFSPVIPWPPRLFAEAKKGELNGFSRPSLSSAPAFLPGQQEGGAERPTTLEMIQKGSLQAAEGRSFRFPPLIRNHLLSPTSLFFLPPRSLAVFSHKLKK